MRLSLEFFLGLMSLSGAIGVVIYAQRVKRTPEVKGFMTEEDERMAAVLEKARRDDEDRSK
jgi:hypothetical protein